MTHEYLKSLRLKEFTSTRGEEECGETTGEIVMEAMSRGGGPAEAGNARAPEKGERHRERERTTVA